MVLNYYGQTCFKIQSGETVIAVDPFAKGGDLPAPRFEAAAILFTDPNASKNVSITGEPLVFSTPGEYETKDIIIVGFPTPEGTAFYIEWENMKLLHLGAIQKKESVESFLDHIDTIDMLCIAAGGSTSDTQKILAQIDPRIIIPMQPADAKKNAIESFVKELGKKEERLDKLTIKSKGLPADTQRIVVLDAA